MQRFRREGGTAVLMSGVKDPRVIVGIRPAANGSQGIVKDDEGTWMDFEGTWFQVVTSKGGALDPGVLLVFEGANGDMHVLGQDGAGRQSLLMTDPTISSWIQILGPLDSLGSRVTLNTPASNRRVTLTDDGLELGSETDVWGGRFAAAFDKVDLGFSPKNGTLPNCDWSSYSVASRRIDGAATVTFTWPTMQDGEMYTVLFALYVENVASPSITWPSGINWSGNNPPEIEANNWGRYFVYFTRVQMANTNWDVFGAAVPPRTG